MTSSLISVIVPAFNIGKSIHYCLDSLKRQNYSNYEIIIVNDGSTDDTGSICEHYCERDNRFRVIHKNNEGPSIARNIGVQEAKGEYILFVDCDDYVEVDYVYSFVEAKSLYPNYEHIWCSFQTVTDYKSNNAVSYYFEQNEKYSFSSKKEIVLLYEKWLVNFPWNKLYKREILINHQIKMREHISLGEDVIFNFEYLDTVVDDGILIINDPKYSYVRNGSESLDNKYRKDLFDIYREINLSILFHLEKWGITKDQINKFYFFCYGNILAVLRNTYHKNNRSSITSKIEYNNHILKTPEAKLYFEHSQTKLDPVSRIAFRTQNYLTFYFFNWLNSLLIRIKDCYFKMKSRIFYLIK